jgi:hypothetical protein
MNSNCHDDDANTSRDTPLQAPRANKRDQILVELSLLLETVRRVSLVLDDIDALTTTFHLDEEVDGDADNDVHPKSDNRCRSEVKRKSSTARSNTKPSGSSSPPVPHHFTGDPQVAGNSTKKPASIVEKQRLLLEELKQWKTA